MRDRARSSKTHVPPVVRRAASNRSAALAGCRWLLSLSLSLLTLGPAFASSREIYGRVTFGGRPVAEGTRVAVMNSMGSYATTTDRYGAYKIAFKAPQKSNPKKKEYPILSVQYNDQTPELEIKSSGASIRYNVVIHKLPSGTYKLRTETARESRALNHRLRTLP